MLNIDLVIAHAQVQRQTEEERTVAEAEQMHLQEEEWNMAELERIQEQQVLLLLTLQAPLHAHLLLALHLFLSCQGSQDLQTVTSVVTVMPGDVLKRKCYPKTSPKLGFEGYKLLNQAAKL